LYRQGKTPVAAAAGILDQRQRAVDGGAVEALSCPAAGCIEGIIGFESKSPIVEPDFLNKGTQGATSVIAGNGDDIDVVKTAVNRVAVVESIAEAKASDIVAKLQVGGSSPSDALPGAEKRIGDFRIGQVQCGRHYGIGKIEVVEAQTGPIGPAPALGGSDVAES